MAANFDPGSAKSNSDAQTSDYAAAISSSLEDLRSVLRQTSLLTDLNQSTHPSDQLRIKTIHQISDYLIPRLCNLNAPLLAVVGGSTGSGKSTLVNSLLQDRVSVSSAVRPTTKVPVLAHNPQDNLWFEDQRILPELQRVYVTGTDRNSTITATSRLLLAPNGRVPTGIALLDAPDIDSVSDANRALSAQLLNAADLWIFVTTANRYADALPWDMLTEAGSRDITVFIVLNRVPDGAESEIVPDLQRLLKEHQLDPSRLHVIPEVELDPHGFIPIQYVDNLKSWIESLASDAQVRHRIAAQTLDGALKRTAADISELLAELREQEGQLQELKLNVEERFDQALEKSSEALNDGAMLRGEILTRWQDFVGTGELLRGIESTVGRVRDRIGSFFSGKPPAGQRVEQAIESGLHTIFVSEITKACKDTDQTWKNTPFGRALLQSLPEHRPAADLEEQAAQSIRAWQNDVLAMIRQEGAGKRKSARIAAIGVNGVAVILMVVVFASTAGLTGIELGIAGGSAVVGQKLLEAIFGEDAVRRMAARARTILDERTSELIRRSSGVYLEVIASHEQPESIAQLTEFVREQGKKGQHS
ncbi:dynamin family protein [Glutamicibacter sp.]|uniref:dynamin family protein n=1 Tax=Glutamicibacter sp. TaxID=1931995 RepID=UPI0028BED14A|nr:dynamin family protein [Glutamicibacter sp.]